MKRQGMNDRVVDLHTRHPDWTAVDIARFLDCTSSYVRATAQRKGLRLPRVQGGARGAFIPAQLLSDLREPADRRGISASELCLRVIQTAAADRMVDAILDDGVAA